MHTSFTKLWPIRAARLGPESGAAESVRVAAWQWSGGCRKCLGIPDNSRVVAESVRGPHNGRVTAGSIRVAVVGCCRKRSGAVKSVQAAESVRVSARRWSDAAESVQVAARQLSGDFWKHSGIPDNGRVTAENVRVAARQWSGGCRKRSGIPDNGRVAAECVRVATQHCGVAARQCLG